MDTNDSKSDVTELAPRFYGPGLVIKREAGSTAVDPLAPIGEPNRRSFSDLADDAVENGDPTALPLTDEDRAYLDTLPVPDPADVERMVARLKSRTV